MLEEKQLKEQEELLRLKEKIKAIKSQPGVSASAVRDRRHKSMGLFSLQKMNDLASRSLRDAEEAERRERTAILRSRNMKTHVAIATSRERELENIMERNTRDKEVSKKAYVKCKELIEEHIQELKQHDNWRLDYYTFRNFDWLISSLLI